MCPIKPGAPLPTKPGVYWRDTAQWVEYDPQQSALIIDGYAALHQAEYNMKSAHSSSASSTRSLRSSSRGLGTTEDFCRSPYGPGAAPDKGMGGGVVAGGLTAETPRGRPQVDLGLIASAAHPRGVNYTVDLRRGVQVSARGFSREVLVVPHNKNASTEHVAHATPVPRGAGKFSGRFASPSGDVHQGEGDDGYIHTDRTKRNGGVTPVVRGGRGAGKIAGSWKERTHAGETPKTPTDMNDLLSPFPLPKKPASVGTIHPEKRTFFKPSSVLLFIILTLWKKKTRDLSARPVLCKHVH